MYNRQGKELHLFKFDKIIEIYLKSELLMIPNFQF